jgi:hypothetical protein
MKPLQAVGTITYSIQGHGSPPEPFPETTISGPQDGTCCRVIEFRNPFDATVQANVALHTNTAASFLRLRDIVGPVAIPARTVLPIPVEFCSKGLSGDVTGNVIVEITVSNETTEFKHPVRGTVKSTTCGHLTVTATAMQRFATVFNLELPGLTFTDGDTLSAAIHMDDPPMLEVKSITVQVRTHTCSCLPGSSPRA